MYRIFGERLRARDKARERAISRKLQELEQKHEFANSEFLKYFAHVSELLEPTGKDAQGKVKPADRMIMILALFDGKKPEKAKTHYKRFNQYTTFQTKEGNIKDTTKEAIELFEHTLDKKALVWFQQHKAEFTDLTTLKNISTVVLLPCGCLCLNPFIEISIRNNSSSSDVLNIQASISISPKFESK